MYTKTLPCGFLPHMALYAKVRLNFASGPILAKYMSQTEKRGLQLMMNHNLTLTLQHVVSSIGHKAATHSWSFIQPRTHLLHQP